MVSKIRKITKFQQERQYHIVSGGTPLPPTIKNSSQNSFVFVFVSRCFLLMVGGRGVSPMVSRFPGSKSCGCLELLFRISPRQCDILGNRLFQRYCIREKKLDRRYTEKRLVSLRTGTLFFGQK